MHNLEVGNIIKGTESANYGLTNEHMEKGLVAGVDGKKVYIDILEHRTRSLEGNEDVPARDVEEGMFKVIGQNKRFKCPYCEEIDTTIEWDKAGKEQQEHYNELFKAEELGQVEEYLFTCPNCERIVNGVELEKKKDDELIINDIEEGMKLRVTDRVPESERVSFQHEFELGSVIEVIRVDKGAELCIRGEKVNGETPYSCWLRIDEVEKIGELTINDLKEGMNLRVVDRGSHYQDIGTIVEVTHIDRSDPNMSVEARPEDGHTSIWFKLSQLEKIEGFEVGDIIKGNNRRYNFKDNKMKKGLVINEDVYNDGQQMRIKVLEHENDSKKGNTYIADNRVSEFTKIGEINDSNYLIK